MYPPTFSRKTGIADDMNPLTQVYRDVAIYEEADANDTLYEGPIVVHANGWIELEGDRLLSPSAVHHIDVYDDIDEPGDEHTGDGTTDDDWTGRFGSR